MRKLLFLLILSFPTFAFGQSFTGNYRAVFFNLFSEPGTVIAEFEVKPDNSLSGRVKIGDEIKNLTGKVEKNGKFEGASEREDEILYKLKGKFDKKNKISFVRRVEIGSGFNRSVSENALEGTFAKVAATETKIETPNAPQQPKAEFIDNGKSRLKIEHSNPMFGTYWTDLTASVGFGNSTKTSMGSEGKKITATADVSDYFSLRVKSKIEGQQSLEISVPIIASDQKIWRQSELRTASYREVKDDARNSFLSGATLQNDPRYAEGKVEIVSETGTQIVFKLIDFKIKRITKDDFVTINGFVYAAILP